MAPQLTESRVMVDPSYNEAVERRVQDGIS